MRYVTVSDVMSFVIINNLGNDFIYSLCHVMYGIVLRHQFILLVSGINYYRNSYPILGNI